MTILICNGCKKAIVGDVEAHDAFCEQSKALRHKTWQEFMSRQERMAWICEKKDGILSEAGRLEKEALGLTEKLFATKR